MTRWTVGTFWVGETDSMRQACDDHVKKGSDNGAKEKNKNGIKRCIHELIRIEMKRES